ncbi:hypothetical protein [Spirillospora sp. NPDC029432]|uniref:hypothetical protein n=1 Tax=Spirillospora sp. NPDC029432 TaxID=3154599 RepID=UPI0034569638
MNHTPTPLLHRTLVAVDIVGFGGREPGVQPYLRKVLRRLVKSALKEAGVPLRSCHHEDRGDGMLVIAPAEAGAGPLLGPFPALLQAGLRSHNLMSSPEARLALRVAVHAGYVATDREGAAGAAANHLFRLLDAASFKAALGDRGAGLGMIVSRYLYDEIVRPGFALPDPGAFVRIEVECKETSCDAWAWFPQEGPAGRAEPDRRLRAVPGEQGP